MAKKPVRGICKLCLKEKDLLDSHLMPKALYSLGESKKVNPIKVTPDYVMTTSRHVRTYLLCLGCETLLNRGGENWLLPLLARPDGRFELYESVTRSQPFAGVSQIAVYSCNNIPAVNVHSVTHFALGILWKASVDSWVASQLDPVIELGPYSESIRRFLLGGQFPNNVILTVTLTPPPAWIVFNVPETAPGVAPRLHWFYVPGILFGLRVGKQLEDEDRLTCIYSAVAHPIVVSQLSGQILNRIKSVAATAKRSKKLLDRDKKAVSPALRGSGSN